MRNVLFASFRVHKCLDSSVAFRLLAFRKNVVRFRYRSLKFDASPTYDSVVVTVVTVVSVSFGRPRSLGGIYHQVGILLSSCSCSPGHDFSLGSLLHFRVSVCYVMR